MINLLLLMMLMRRWEPLGVETLSCCTIGDTSDAVEDVSD